MPTHYDQYDKIHKIRKQEAPKNPTRTFQQMAENLGKRLDEKRMKDHD